MGFGLQQYAFEGYGWLAGVFLAFKAWMLMDSIRSGNDRMWYIILFVPFGEFVYFLMFKANDPQIRRRILRLLPKGRVNLDHLRREAEQSPSQRNRELYADGLLEARRFAEASAIYEQLLKSTSENKSLLMRLALCAKGAGNAQAASDILRSIVGRDPKFADYRAAIELAAIEREQGRVSEAATLMKTVNEQTSRLDLRLELARAMMGCSGGSKAELEALLDDIIADFRTSPAFYRRENRRVFREARRLRRDVGQMAVTD